MDVPVIVLGFILVIVLYVLYSYFNSKKTSLGKARLLGTSAPADQINNMTYKNVVNPTSPNYYISYWIYVAEYKHIPAGNPNMFSLTTAQGATVIIGVQLKSDGTLLYNRAVGSSTSECVISTNFPIQRWSHLIISVQSNNLIDCYLDGKLVKSKTESTPLISPTVASVIEESTIPENKIYIGGVVRKPVTMDPATAWNLYSAGNGGNSIAKMFSQYGVALQFVKDKEVKAEIDFPP